MLQCVDIAVWPFAVAHHDRVETPIQSAGPDRVDRPGDVGRLSIIGSIPRIRSDISFNLRQQGLDLRGVIFRSRRQRLGDDVLGMGIDTQMLFGVCQVFSVTDLSCGYSVFDRDGKLVEGFPPFFDRFSPLFSDVL